MSIIDGEEMCFYSLFFDVESDANPILVIVPGNALMCVDSIAFDDSILLIGCFGGFDGRKWLFELLFFIFDAGIQCYFFFMFTCFD